MKIIGWTWYGNHEYKRLCCNTYEQIAHIEKIIATEIRNKGYKFTGDYHQEGDYGVPIFDNGMIYECSKRVWGDIMVQAYPDEIDNIDGMGYCTWAWLAPEPMVVPKESDYSKEEK